MSDNSVLVDMHVHSIHSHDSSISLDTIISVIRKYGIFPIICDHDSIGGSLELAKYFRKHDIMFPEILAEEITTSEGEIIGIFLTEEIIPGLSAIETCEIIKSQGGLTIVPHPFDHFRKKSLNISVLEEIKGKIDIIEGYNARVLLHRDNKFAREYAGRSMIPVSIGSDAHTSKELGKCYGIFEHFDSAKTFLRNIRSMSVEFHYSGPYVHFITKMRKICQ
jgi:predicted metal-dependent phosphoesterase TrpH